jgi:hypothetical protein
MFKQQFYSLCSTKRTRDYCLYGGAFASFSARKAYSFATAKVLPIDINGKQVNSLSVFFSNDIETTWLFCPDYGDGVASVVLFYVENNQIKDKCIEWLSAGEKDYDVKSKLIDETSQKEWTDRYNYITERLGMVSSKQELDTTSAVFYPMHKEVMNYICLNRPSVLPEDDTLINLITDKAPLPAIKDYYDKYLTKKEYDFLAEYIQPGYSPYKRHGVTREYALFLMATAYLELTWSVLQSIPGFGLDVWSTIFQGIRIDTDKKELEALFDYGNGEQVVLYVDDDCWYNLDAFRMETFEYSRYKTIDKYFNISTLTHFNKEDRKCSALLESFTLSNLINSNHIKIPDDPICPVKSTTWSSGPVDSLYFWFTLQDGDITTIIDTNIFQDYKNRSCYFLEYLPVVRY